MEWLLPYKLESDEAQISGHQKTRPQAVESNPEGHAPHWTEHRGGPWALICAAMAHIWRSSECSKS
jgi:hypothetical protein